MISSQLQMERQLRYIFLGSLTHKKGSLGYHHSLIVSALYFQVNNTDAEGRLCLADALIYTCNLGVEKVNIQ